MLGRQVPWRNVPIPPKSPKGAVAIEFAVVAPVLMTVIVGLIQVARVYAVQNNLKLACREGARVAALDRSETLQLGQTANSKLVSDVKTYLASSGIDPKKLTVNVLDAADPTKAFNLDDPANDLKLFRVRVTVPYSAVSYTPVTSSHDYDVSASITFRNGDATMSQK